MKPSRHPPHPRHPPLQAQTLSGNWIVTADFYGARYLRLDLGVLGEDNPAAGGDKLGALSPDALHLLAKADGSSRSPSHDRQDTHRDRLRRSGSLSLLTTTLTRLRR